MIFALIKDGFVQNTIVADQDFIDGVKDQYDACVEISLSPGSPSIGWSYDGEVFSAPVVDES